MYRVVSVLKHELFKISLQQKQVSYQESDLFYVNPQMTFKECEAVEPEHPRMVLRPPLYTSLDSPPQGIVFMPWASCLRVGISCP